MKDIVIMGAGGFGRETACLIESINEKSKLWSVIGFIDDNPKVHGKSINGIGVLGGLEWLKHRDNLYYTCAIGNPEIRRHIVNKCREHNIHPATLVHPNVRISTHNHVGEGCIICSGSNLTVNIHIGNYVILNLNCTVGHDAEIGDFSTVYPGVNISGNVSIGSQCELGTGSAIIQGIKLGNQVVVGAKAAVIRNIPDKCTAVGVPAKIIKSSCIEENSYANT